MFYFVTSERLTPEVLDSVVAKGWGDPYSFRKKLQVMKRREVFPGRQVLLLYRYQPKNSLSFIGSRRHSCCPHPMAVSRGLFRQGKNADTRPHEVLAGIEESL